MKTANMNANVSAGHAFAATQVPSVDATSTFDFQLFRAIDTIVDVVKSIQQDDPHLYLETLLLINMIPDPKWREARLEEFHRELSLFTTSGAVNFKDVRAHIACLNMIGCVSDWQAQYRMTVRHNLIGSE